jgi:hypothetical protein
MFDDPKFKVGLVLFVLYIVVTYIKIVIDRWTELSLEIEREKEELARLENEQPKNPKN